MPGDGEVVVIPPGGSGVQKIDAGRLASKSDSVDHAVSVIPNGMAGGGTAFLVASAPNSDDVTTMIIFSPTGSHKSVKVPGRVAGSVIGIYHNKPVDFLYVFAAQSPTKDASTMVAIDTNGDPTTLDIQGAVGGAVTDPSGTYVVSSGDSGHQTLSRIRPDGTIESLATFDGPNLCCGTPDQMIVVAPPGTADAGTVFIAEDTSLHGRLMIIGPDHSVTTVKTTGFPTAVAMAPAGTPAAGTAYLAMSSNAATTVKVINPDLTTRDIDLKPSLQAYHGTGSIAIAPAGTPNAGKVYVSLGELFRLTTAGLTTIIPISDEIAGRLEIGGAGSAYPGAVLTVANTKSDRHQMILVRIDPSNAVSTRPLTDDGFGGLGMLALAQ